VHTGGPSGGVSLIAAARCALSATVILTEHDAPTRALAVSQRILRAWMDRWSHAIVAVSRRNAQLRTERLGVAPGKFAVVLNGVPFRNAEPAVQEQHRRTVRAQFDINPAAVVLGSVVRLVDGKGLDDLLRAFAIVRREEPSTMLLLVGDGPLRQDLERLSKSLGTDSNVFFAGQHDDPYPFLDAMDAFVLAVPVGSMSIALLEAMARGLAPVITFSGPEEAVIPEETGLAAPPNDPEGLALVLLRLTRDQALRSRLAAAAASHVARNFSVKRVADELLEIYAAVRRGTVPPRLRF
jgi:glycosyltransferase involved in cell wall biosynthesis